MKKFYFMILAVIFGIAAFPIICRAAQESQLSYDKSLSPSFNLDKIRMNVVKTAESGVVNYETIFVFSQNNDAISAEYTGGKIQKGFLVGKFLSGNQITFSYCQMQHDGTIDNGVSTCEVTKNEQGKVTLIENFEWKSRPGEFGTNIFQEI